MYDEFSGSSRFWRSRRSVVADDSPNALPSDLKTPAERPRVFSWRGTMSAYRSTIRSREAHLEPVPVADAQV